MMDAVPDTAARTPIYLFHQFLCFWRGIGEDCLFAVPGFERCGAAVLFGIDASCGGGVVPSLTRLGYPSDAVHGPGRPSTAR